MTLKWSRTLAALAVLAIALPAAGADPKRSVQHSFDSTMRADRSGAGLQGWGLRGGIALEPDQLLFGSFWDLGEITRNLRFRPDLELGIGDDVTSLYATLPFYYHFATRSSWTPYAGGGPALGYVNVNRSAFEGGDNASVELGVRATGGLERTLRYGQRFFIEVALGFGDVHDLRLGGGWNF